MVLSRICVIVLIINCDVLKIVSGFSTYDIRQLSVVDGLLSKNLSRYTAIADKPFDINLENISISYGWCSDFYLGTDISPTVDVTGIHFDNISDVFNTLWQCVIQEDNGWDSNSILLLKKYKLFFYLHVKGAKRVRMSVNNTVVSFVRANLSVPHDGEAIYFFKEGDTVYVSCENAYKTGYVTLQKVKNNINEDSSRNDTKNNTQIAKMSVKFTSKYEYSSIECIYTSNFSDKYIYKINFLPKLETTVGQKSGRTTQLEISGMITTNVPKVLKNQHSSSTVKEVAVSWSIGVLVLIITLIGAGYWYIRWRNAKRNDAPAIPFTDYNDNPTQAFPNEYSMPDCNYENEGYYEVPESLENTDTTENYYAEIDYAMCGQKIDGINRESVVYDEPYRQITVAKRIEHVKGLDQ